MLLIYQYFIILFDLRYLDHTYTLLEPLIHCNRRLLNYKLLIMSLVIYFFIILIILYLITINFKFLQIKQSLLFLPNFIMQIILFSYTIMQYQFYFQHTLTLNDLSYILHYCSLYLILIKYVHIILVVYMVNIMEFHTLFFQYLLKKPF